MPLSKIDIDSKNRSIELYDIEFFRNQYKLCDDFFKDGVAIVDNPYIELLAQNYDFLKENSVNVDLDKKYVYRPDYLSYDIYGTTSLWQML